MKTLSTSESGKSSNVDNVIQLYNIVSKGNSDPYTINAKVNGIVFNLELDSGAAVSVFLMEIFKLNFPQIELERSDTKLSGYGGNNLKVEGSFTASIEYSGNDLEFIVVDASGPLILGRIFFFNF